ncbi:MAG TPA: hypothetical protein VNS53_04145 [Sphingomicrobium sp.]|nr:hypothetical protein [Sphingomicrobium sp.]
MARLFKVSANPLKLGKVARRIGLGGGGGRGRLGSSKGGGEYRYERRHRST